MADRAGAAEWTYPLEYGDTLSNHDWMPLYLNRLLTSRFLAYTVAEDRRADGFTAFVLWCESMRQDPAGTLPDDDVELAQLARFGSDLAAWREARPGALYGWEPVAITNADDGGAGRLGHEVIASIASDMHVRKRGRDRSREANKEAQMRSRVRRKMAALKLPRHLRENEQVVQSVADYLKSGDLYVTDENVRMALEEAVGVPRVVGLREGE